ncbi:MAG: phosphate acyltransferase PlsX [Oscillospiraceae bacterium]|jgi:glycerol-3-phosphate acyltransferase PlsX
MKIVIDAFGGDYAPIEPIKGARLSRDKFGCDIVLSGNEEKIRKVAGENGIDLSDIDVVDAASVITMEDDPKSVLKAKSDSSMAVGLKCLSGGNADAFISAGSTAALLMGGTFIVKRIKGVARPALACAIPGMKGYTLIIDCGANTECRPEMLSQFGFMGAKYMQNVLGVRNPRVGILSNGTETTKGTDLQRQAYAIMKDDQRINFVGNVEGRAICLSECDVVVTDGFTGNITLKTLEGLGKMVGSKLKETVFGSTRAKIGAAFMAKELKGLAKTLDYREVGGAPFIGLRKPVIKAHGNSNAKMFAAAVNQAIKWAGSDTTEAIEEAFSEEKAESDD